MKYKSLLILLFLFAFLFVGCNPNDNSEKLLDEFLEKFSQDFELNPKDEKFDLLDKVVYGGKEISLKWSFSEEILDENNKIIHKDESFKSTLTLEATLGEYSKTIVLGDIISISINDKKAEETLKILEKFAQTFVFEQTSDYEVDLVKSCEYEGMNIELSWKFSEEIVDEAGMIIHKETEQKAKVTVVFKVDDVTFEKEVGIIVSISISDMEAKYGDIEKNTIKKFKESFVLEQIGDEKVVFLDEVELDGKKITLTWEYEKIFLKSDGTIKHGSVRAETEVFVVAKYGSYSERFSVGKILVKSSEELLLEVIGGFELPKETNDDIVLPTRINGVDISWYSDDEDILSNSGKCYYVSKDTTLTISAFFSCGKSEKDVEYVIVIKPYANQKRLQLALDEIEIPYIVSGDIDLLEEYPYDTKAIWTSSRSDVISEKGIVKLSNESVDVVLKLKLYIGEDYMEKEFSVKTAVMHKLNMHYMVERANDFDKGNMFNLEVKDGKVVLKSGEIYGYYDSAIYETLNFKELVGSWSATSSKVATCELLVKIRVNGEWSKYFTYGIWGLGRNNLYYNQNDKNAKMSVDEILPTNGLGDAFQYRIILRRDTQDAESAKLSLVAMAMRIPDYKFDVDTSNLPDFVDYDVPKVNQNVVPEIGSVICSATTSTMLLKYKGFDFSEYDEYENRYVANLVADRGHNSPTYGNWVYNTVTMGAFGLNSYVKHLYSWEELKYHLATVGPVGASIAGNAILYNTNGHLIVARGYRVVDGKTYVICNDPNINQRFGNDKDGNPYFVYYEFPLETFMNFWRGTIYVVE